VGLEHEGAPHQLVMVMVTVVVAAAGSLPATGRPPEAMARRTACPVTDTRGAFEIYHRRN
jgi:hypothetical protein